MLLNYTWKYIIRSTAKVNGEFVENLYTVFSKYNCNDIVRIFSDFLKRKDANLGVLIYYDNLEFEVVDFEPCI